MLIAVVGALSACDLNREASAGADGSIRIGTGGAGGIYHPLGEALAARLTVADSARTYIAEFTGGSIENLESVAAGELDLGMAIGTTLHAAYNGREGFARPLRNLRVIAPLYANLTQVLARPEAGIAGIADIRGHTVAVGPVGGGTEQVAQQLFEQFGFMPEDVVPQNLNFSDAADALQRREIDAAVLSVGYPAGAVAAALRSGAILLPIDSTHVARLAERYPYYSLGEIPAGAYPGISAPVPTSSVLNWIVGRADLPDDVVLKVLETLYSSGAQLQRAVGIEAAINLSNLYAAPIDMHPAARAWLDRTPAGR